MAPGGFFSNAWNSATSAAKSAATSIANGASWAGGKIADGAKWTGDKIAQGAQWAGDMAKEGTRRVIRGTTDAIYTGLGTDAQNVHDVGKAVKGAYDKTKSVFTNKPPEQPCINCTGKDVDHDGVLVGYKDGKCVPLTQKGQPVTPDDIKAAKRAGYSPANNAAYDKENPKDPAKNTSDATKACCAKCTAGKPPRTIFYVNGINTTHTTHCETLKQIGDMTCANVVGIYNATEGMPKDAIQTSQDRTLIDQADAGRKNLAHDGRNPAVDTLSDLIVQETRAGRPRTRRCRRDGHVLGARPRSHLHGG